MPSANVIWAPPLTRLTPFYPGQPGVPGTDHDRGLRLDSNGKILWVDPNHVDAHDQRDGTNPDSPMRTVGAALTKCRAYSGDTIVVAPSAYWTYSNLGLGRAVPIAEEVVVTVPGMRIVGLYPSGQLGVPWKVTQDNGVAITVHAMDVLIEGFCFWENVYTGAVGIRAEWDAPTAYGENLTVRHCFFGYGLDYGIQLDWAYNVRIEDNAFQIITTAAIHNLAVEGDPDFLIVRRNDFNACTVALNAPGADEMIIEDNVMANCPTGIVMTGSSYCTVQHNKINTTVGSGVVAISGAAADENIIHDNIINGSGAGTNNMINLTGGSNNMVSGNWLACTIAQYDTTCSDATSGAWPGNHCTDGVPVAPPT